MSIPRFYLSVSTDGLCLFAGYLPFETWTPLLLFRREELWNKEVIGHLWPRLAAPTHCWSTYNSATVVEQQQSTSHNENLLTWMWFTNVHFCLFNWSNIYERQGCPFPLLCWTHANVIAISRRPEQIYREERGDCWKNIVTRKLTKSSQMRKKQRLKRQKGQLRRRASPAHDHKCIYIIFVL